MKNFLRMLILFFGLTIQSFLSNAAPVPAYGTWLSYFPTNKLYKMQFNHNGQYLGPVGIKQVPDSLPRYDIYNGVNGSVCGPGVIVEEWKVKNCTMTNMATGVVTSAQFVVLLGVRNALSPTRYLIQVPTLNGRKTAEFYWDNNGNNIIDNGDTGYIVSCPNYGQPYTLLNIDSVPSIMRVWYNVDVSGNGSSFTQRQFWQGLVRPPVNKFNPVYGATGYTALSLSVSEAWWVDGVWKIGVGSVGYLSDGKIWPTGANVQYGRTMWDAKDLGPFWQVEQWWPYENTFGIDSVISGFSPGC